MSVTTLLTSYADSTFFPNVRELLKILAVLPVGSTEAERSFSCLRRLHTWLRNTMKTDRLSDLAVIAMHGYTIPITYEQIYKRFIVVLLAVCRDPLFLIMLIKIDYCICAVIRIFDETRRVVVLLNPRR